MSEIFRRLDERAALERVRADRVRRVAGAVIYLAAALVIVWIGIGDLKGPAGSHGARVVGAPIVAALDFLVAASMLPMAALLIRSAPPDKSRWRLAAVGAVLFAMAASTAARRDWADLWFDGSAAVLGLFVLGSVANALVPARKQQAS
jgi:hypothetical protein